MKTELAPTPLVVTFYLLGILIPLAIALFWVYAADRVRARQGDATGAPWRGVLVGLAVLGAFKALTSVAYVLTPGRRPVTNEHVVVTQPTAFVVLALTVIGFNLWLRRASRGQRSKHGPDQTSRQSH